MTNLKKKNAKNTTSNFTDAYGKFSAESMKATKTSKDIETDIDRDYERHPKPYTQMEVGEDHLLAKLKNHIVVCGIHSSIMHFILPLRAKYLKS